MNFVDISTLNIDTELDALRRGTQRYSLLIYQHKGVFFADENRIGNNDQKDAEKKFIKLLKKAKVENISLVVSPEYSCPKSVVDLIIEDESLRPSNNKLWSLGGESLNKDDLNQLSEINNDSVYIHFEDVHNDSDKNYVDPLYYIFLGQHDGTEKLIVLIQFKSWHMGGLWSSQLEPDNLIQGSDVYVIKNDENSVRLISLICSQAMNFNPTLEQNLIDNHGWVDSPFLFLSLQFNPNPSHQNFIDFKKFVLTREKRELITLNWGMETCFPNGKKLYDEYNAPRSGIYFKTSDVELDYKPKKIIDNHQKGLYFLQIKRKKRVYFLNRKIELFKIHNKSVDIAEGVDEQQRREGPTASNVYVFDDYHEIEEIEKVEDNHIDFLEDRGITNSYLLDRDISVVNKERLFNISNGQVEGNKENKWAEVIHLNSFILNESDECNNRLTYLEDSYESSERIRSINCSNLIELDVNIISDKGTYPHSIRHLAEKEIKLAFAENADTYKYKYNVVNKHEDIEKATVCYIGSAVSQQLVNKTYDELQKLFDPDSPGKNTIVVFFKNGNDILDKSNPDAGSITEPPKDDSSIF